jgi:hypothetical protein
MSPTLHDDANAGVEQHAVDDDAAEVDWYGADCSIDRDDRRDFHSRNTSLGNWMKLKHRRNLAPADDDDVAGACERVDLADVVASFDGVDRVTTLLALSIEMPDVFWCPLVVHQGHCLDSEPGRSLDPAVTVVGELHSHDHGHMASNCAVLATNDVDDDDGDDLREQVDDDDVHSRRLTTHPPHLHPPISEPPNFDCISR